jgi:hypothetical protein
VRALAGRSQETGRSAEKQNRHEKRLSQQCLSPSVL